MKAKLSLLILCLIFFSCATPGPLPDRGVCLPHFPDRDGWYGGDGAYSIDLDEQRTLWLFGDTFASSESARTNRAGMDIISGNTLAISTCNADGFHIRYYLKKRDGRFASFFGDDETLWPQSPFLAERALLIPLLEIKPLPDKEPPFNFRIAGHKIAYIRNFSAKDPMSWRVDELDWSQAIDAGIDALAPASVVFQHQVYFFSLYRAGNKAGNILARLSLARLDHPAGAFEYLHDDGGWENRIDPKRIKILFTEGLSELSVRYDPQKRRWIAVYLNPENKGRRVLYRVAPHLDGPWSSPGTLFETIPEVDPQSPQYHPKTFCYAGKEHARFSSAQSLVVTYVCNSSEDPTDPESFIARHLFLYRPVVLQIPAP